MFFIYSSVLKVFLFFFTQYRKKKINIHDFQKYHLLQQIKQLNFQLKTYKNFNSYNRNKIFFFN